MVAMVPMVPPIGHGDDIEFEDVYPPMVMVMVNGFYIEFEDIKLWGPYENC